MMSVCPPSEDSALGLKSACPSESPASSPPEDTQEGYVVFTFNKDKQARVKIATFADVSEACYFDEIVYADAAAAAADDDDDDEEEEEGGQNLLHKLSDGIVREQSLLNQGVDSRLQSTAGSAGVSRLATVATALRCGLSLSRLTGTAAPSLLRHSSLRRFSYPDGDTRYDLIGPPPRTALPPVAGTSTLAAGARSPPLGQSPRVRARAQSPGGSGSRKMLRCEECGKYYRNEYSLHHHICLKRKDVWKKGDVPSQLIDGQMVYFCPACSKPFKWLGNLTRHYYVHTGQRFFKCDICQKEFFSAYQVKRHMNSHTGVRFNCALCDKPFTCKYACAWHTRQHYTCPG